MAEQEVRQDSDSSDDEETDEYIRLFSHREQFFLEEPYVYLINPDLFPEKVRYIKEFHLKEILPDFHGKLLDQGLDFRILGQAIYSAARIHKKKVSLALQYEKKQEEKIAIRTKRKAFQFKIPLAYYITREILSLAESANPEEFYAELLLALQEEDEKKKIEKLKKERNKQQGTAEATRKRRKLELADFEGFDYKLDLDRVAIEDIVNNTFDIIKTLADKDKNKEAEFSKVVNSMGAQEGSEEHKRLTRARVLISLLYLFRDERITAEQELHPPYEIYIQVFKKGKKKENKV